MKRFKLLAITGAGLVILAVLAGCASMIIVGADKDSVTGPKQVRQYGTIDPKSITVTAIFKNGDRKPEHPTRGVSFDNSKAGKQTVTFKMGDDTLSFEIEVMPLTGIKIVSPPKAWMLGVAAPRLAKSSGGSGMRGGGRRKILPPDLLRNIIILFPGLRYRLCGIKWATRKSSLAIVLLPVSMKTRQKSRLLLLDIRINKPASI
jgi:hypothetical protein